MSLKMESIVLPFRHPTSILVAGPSQSGKTHFVKRVLRDRMIQPSPRRVKWVYSAKRDPEFAALQQEFPGIEFFGDLDPEIFQNIDPSEPNLIILDDVMTEAAKSADVSRLFTRDCHHSNCTTIFIVQNLFCQEKQMRTISLNSHYIVLYKQPRDKTQVRTLALQVAPEDSKFVLQVYSDATAQPHTYLLFDFHPETPDPWRLRTNIFPKERVRIFLPPNSELPQLGYKKQPNGPLSSKRSFADLSDQESEEITVKKNH